MRSRIVFFVCMWLVGLFARSQGICVDSLQRHQYIVRSTSYGIGSIRLLDTYLSPMEYAGSQLHMVRESTRMLRKGEGRISRQTLFHAYVAGAENGAGTASELAGMLDWNYAWHYNFSLADGKLRLLLGPMLQLHGGFIYNTRNSNNPAQAKLGVDLAASGMAVYRDKLKRLPFTMRYQLDVPLLGVMFSPQYQQSYYEIFSLGHYDGTIVLTSIHNRPVLRHWFTVDMEFRPFTLRLGYMADMQQSEVNDIKYHAYTHSFMIGVVKRLYRL